MKVSIDIDCTPEEARAFLGLPEVAPMQEAVMEKLQQQILKNLASMDPEALMLAESRLAAIQASARKFQIRPEFIPDVLQETQARHVK